MQFCLVQRILKIQHSLRTKKIIKHIDAFTLIVSYWRRFQYAKYIPRIKLDLNL